MNDELKKKLNELAGLLVWGMVLKQTMHNNPQIELESEIYCDFMALLRKDEQLEKGAKNG